MSVIESVIDIPAEYMGNIFGSFDANIKKIEKTLKVTIVLRGDALKIIGGEAAVNSAASVFERLIELAKRGGYLVIEQTEALTVIDVNTGKYDGKDKDREDTFLKINMEAAEEVERQLRLRNISGIVVVDFINMKDDNIKILTDELCVQLKKDIVKCKYVDYTKLGLVEITRQKIRRSLIEYFTKNS